MKKNLVALAALAATSAFAQSSVQLDGLVDAGFRNRSSQTATDKVGRVQVNNTATSAFFFRGTEDIGGGMKAMFLAELDWNPTQSQATGGDAGAQYYVGTPFNGEQFVGLEDAKLGKIRIGSPNSAILEANGQAQPFGTALGGGYMNTGVNRLGAATVTTLGINQYAGGVEAAGRVIRYERAIRYDTPVFNGFSASYLYSAQNGKQSDVTAKANANNNGVNELGLKYSQGPLNVSYAQSTIEAGAYAGTGGVAVTSTFTGTSAANAAAAGTVASAFTTAAGALAAGQNVKYSYAAANYTFGATTVYGGLTTGKTGGGLTSMDTASKNIAVKYQVNGALAVMANVLRVDDKLAANQDAKLVGLGADYALSKRTTAYYRFEQADSKVADTAAGKYVTQAIGLRHTF